MADNSHIGRKVAVGVAIEGDRGTAEAAAQHWVKHMKADFYDRQDTIENESAMGVDEKINDSEVASKWADGSIEGKITVDSFGTILSGMFGSPTTTEEGAGYKHVFEFSDTLGSLTLFRKSKVNDKKFAKVTLSSLEIEAKAKEWVMFSSEATALKGVAASSTPAYAEEAEFSGKNVVVKIATTEAGLAAADRILLKSVKSTTDRDVEPYFGLGNEAPDEIDAQTIETGGEFVLRYGDEDFETMWKNNAKVWMSITMTNTAVDLGSGLNPSLTIIYPKVSIRELKLSDDLDKIVDQTLNFTAEYSVDEGKAISVELVNGVETYVAAV